MTAAVEREVSNYYFFSFFFDVPSMGIRLKRVRNEVYIKPKGISPLESLLACRMGVVPWPNKPASPQC
jgi:hypothetical protein